MIATKKIRPQKTLIARMNRVRLPQSAFYLDESKELVILLTNLKIADPELQRRHCDCQQVTGVHVVKDGTVKYENRYTVSMSSCHETLASAVAQMAYRKRVAERTSFVQTNNRYNTNQSRRIKLLQLWPSLVLQHLVDEFKVEQGHGLTPTTLKLADYRLAIADGGYEKLFEQIVAEKFPDLVGDDSEDD